MAAPRTVQFRGIDQVVEAYENWAIPSWSVWCGSEFNFRWVGKSINEGADKLHAWLTALSGNGTSAIYRLCVYEGPAGDVINNKTPYDGSFNFTLQEQSINWVDGMPGGLMGLVSTVNAIKKKMDDWEAEPETPEPVKVEKPVIDDFGLGKIGIAMQHPALQPFIPLLTNKVMDWLLNENKTPQLMKDRTARIAGPDNTISEEARVNRAMGILKTADPGFIETLEKLALLATNKPDTFNFYIQTFKAMAV